MNFIIDRLNGDMQRVIAEIIEHKIKDPRKTEIVSVTKVSVAKDLKTAKIYLSIYGEQEKADATFNAVVRSTGYIKCELAKEFRDIRQIPDLTFIRDTTMEYSRKIDEILKEIKENEHAD